MTEMIAQQELPKEKGTSTEAHSQYREAEQFLHEQLLQKIVGAREAPQDMHHRDASSSASMFMTHPAACACGHACEGKSSDHSKETVLGHFAAQAWQLARTRLHATFQDMGWIVTG